MIGVRIAREISSSPSSYKDASIMDEYGDAGISSEVQQIISSEVKKAVESSQNQILSSMKTLIDSNFKNFQSSMETTQKELSSSQLAKIEENIFGSYKFKRHGNEAQYRGNAQVITKLREADASLDSANLGVENINTARTKIGEETRDFELFSDASDVGYGGYINPTVQRSDKSSSQQGGDIVLQKDRVTVSGSWSQRECNKSSTWRELESVHRIINTHSDDLKGLHSLRSGGATAAVGSNVNERCIKRHGRWKCDSSKDMYVVDQLENRLAVSRKLGL
uniref:Uncharacterized protein n=1 Tax=Magallana gigas TaxID=29159 RepID=A0A8W8IRD0_MAGGI